MKRIHRKITRRVRRHHKRQLSFLQAVRLYAGVPFVAFKRLAREF